VNPLAVQPHILAASSRRVPPAFIEKAEKHRRRGELDKALEACEKVINQCPGYVSGHIALARVRLDMGDMPAAQDALNAAITLDPMNPVAQNLLARLDLAGGLNEKATRRLKDILFFYPNDVEAAALLVDASRPTPAQQARPSSEPAAVAPATAQTPAEVAQAELENLRTTPGVTGAVVVDPQGLPVWGSLGRGEQADSITAAKTSAALQVWGDAWAEAGRPSRAIIESSAGRLAIVPCGDSVLIVGLSPRIRPGRVLGIIDQAAEKLKAVSAAQHEGYPFGTE